MHNHLIAPHVQAFFADYLCQQRRLSPQTILSCRDTFRLLLTFLRDHTGVEPSALRIADVDAPVVLRFLTYLEQERGTPCAHAISAYPPSGRSFVWWRCAIPDSLGIVDARACHSHQARGQKTDRVPHADGNASPAGNARHRRNGWGGAIMPCC